MPSAKQINKALTGMDESIIEQMNENGLVGLGAAVIHRGDPVYVKGFGLADAAQGREVTPETVFRIGSISKTLTAIGLMRLWEQGMFDLDDPVNEHLKSFSIQHRDPNAPPVTIRHMLTHRSGLGELRRTSDLLKKPMFGLGVEYGDPIPALADYYAAGLSPEVYPETKWAYANHAFGALGQLIEDLSGEPFADYMLRHVFEPLSMEHTDYLRSERVIDQLAIGYEIKRNRVEPARDVEIAIAGAGSVFSSLEDMVRYGQALLNNGRNEHGAVVKPETLAMMMDVQFEVGDGLPGMGLAFLHEQIGPHHVVWHDGGWVGFVSAMWMVPAEDPAVLVFTNMSSEAPPQIAVKMLRQLLDVPEPETQLPRPGILEAPHLWSELCGSYGPKPGPLTNARAWMMFGGEMNVVVKDNRLMVQPFSGEARKGLPLYRIDADDPYVYATAFHGQEFRVVFGRDKDGRVDRLRLGLMYTELYKRPATQGVRFRVGVGLAALGSLVLFLIGWRKIRRK